MAQDLPAGFEPSAALLNVLLEAQVEGRVGPGSPAHHIEHALGFASHIPPFLQGGALVDLGSGGGLPGLVLAEYFPSLDIILLDGRASRAQALERAVETLGLSGRVSVLGERAEVVGRDIAMRSSIDVVVARSFGRPGVVAECAAPLLRVGGGLIVSEPPNDQASVSRWPSDGSAVFGLELERIEGEPAFAVLKQISLCPAEYPRRVGIPGKRPIF